MNREVLVEDGLLPAALIVGDVEANLVALRALLDGRQVDHPDLQRDKRERAAQLTPVSTDLRFVPVDFERDELDKATTDAGLARAVRVHGSKR